MPFVAQRESLDAQRGWKPLCHQMRGVEHGAETALLTDLRCTHSHSRCTSQRTARRWPVSYISAMDRVARFRPRVRGIASLEGMEGLGYSCWIDPEDRRIPVFALEVGLRIAAECSCPMYGVRYDRLRLTFREFSDQDWGLVADCPRACPDFIAPDGARVHAIGFWHGWAWDVAAIFC